MSYSLYSLSVHVMCDVEPDVPWVFLSLSFFPFDVWRGRKDENVICVTAALWGFLGEHLLQFVFPEHPHSMYPKTVLLTFTLELRARDLVSPAFQQFIRLGTVRLSLTMS